MMTRATEKLLGAFLILHGLAHTLPGMRVTDASIIAAGGSAALIWSGTAAWFFTTAGLVAAGLGFLGVAPFRRVRRSSAAVGIVASAWLLLLWHETAWVAFPLLLDVGLLALIEYSARSGTIDEREADPRPKRASRLFGRGAAIALSTYLALLIVARPWHSRWGSSDAELRMPLPGDELTPSANYVIQHGITIAGTPAEIWPWLAQIGQDQAGFYSYAWLENAFGLRVSNADRLHPEWQNISEGDSIFATPPDYLGTGRRFGWRVALVEPNRVLFLEKWGAFVLEQVSSDSTRLIIRTRGKAATRLPSILAAPAGLLVGEPAHFIMERRMLLQIRENVEGSAREALPAGVAAHGRIR